MSARKALLVALAAAVALGLSLTWCTWSEPTLGTDPLGATGQAPHDDALSGPSPSLHAPARTEVAPTTAPTETAELPTGLPAPDTPPVRQTRPMPPPLRGTVRNAEGKPVPGAFVWWALQHPREWSWIAADENGQFILPSAHREVIVRAAHPYSFPEFAEAWRPNDMVSPGGRPHDLVVSDGASVRIRALGLADRRGTPIDPTTVRVQIFVFGRPDLRMERHLDSSGTVEFGGLDRVTGRYQVYVGPTSDGRRVVVRLFPPVPEEVEAQLESVSGHIAGRVEAPESVLKAGVVVDIRPFSGFRFEATVRPDGSFEYEHSDHDYLYGLTARSRDGTWRSERHVCRVGDDDVVLKAAGAAR